MKFSMRFRAVYGSILLLFAFCVISAQWVQTGGPEGGVAMAMAHKGDTLWAATYGGLYFSSDSGNTWSLHSMPRTTFLSLLATDNAVFAGTNSHGCLRLANGGEWENLTQGIGQNASIPSMTLWRERVYAICDYQSIIWSGDNGDTWTACAALPAASSLYAIAGLGQYLFCGAWTGGAFRSSDSGVTWTEANNGMPASPSVISFYVADTVIFAKLSNGVYRSDDKGDTWTACAGPHGNFSACQGICSSGDTVFLAMGYTIFRSLDLGANWDSCAVLPFTARDGALGANGRIILSSAQGFYFTRDGGTSWEKPDKDLLNSYVADLVRSDDTLIALVYEVGIVHSTDLGASWNSIPGIYIPQYLTWMGQTLVGSQYSSVLLSEDNGRTWNPTPFNGGNVTDILFSNGAIYVSTYGKGVFQSLDSGITWDSINTGLPGRDVRALCDAQGTIFAGVYQQGVCRLDGNAWSPINSGIQQDPSRRTIASLVAHDTTVLVGLESAMFGPAIYVSSDRGENWVVADSGLPSRGCNNLFLVDTFIVGIINYFEVYITGDRGATWHPFSDGTDSVRLSSFTVLGDTVFAGSEYHGVWKRPLDEMYAATQSSALQPALSTGVLTPQFYLFPNPVNRNAYLVLWGRGDRATHIDLFDATGRNVLSRTEVRGKCSRLDIGSLPAGMYLVRVTQGKETAVKRIILAR